MGVIRVLSEEGDIRVEWDDNDKESVDKARAEFERLQADGYELYRASNNRRVKTFNPGHHALIAAPGTKKEKSAESRKAALKGTRARPAAMAGGPNTRVARL